jgi:hypothetical protein
MADLTINSVLVQKSSTAETRSQYLFGASVGAGDLVFLNSSNQWALVDSNGSGTGTNVTDLRGVALCNGATNQPAHVAVSDDALVLGATLTNGVTYYASPNAGKITADVPASGNTTIVVGIGKSATTLALHPFTAGTAV